MTASRVISKGTTVSCGSAGTVPLMVSVEVGEYSNEVFDGTTLDTALQKVQTPAGFTANTTIKVKAYYNGTFAAAVKALAEAAPVVAATVTVTYADSTTDVWSCIKFGVSKSVEAEKAVMAEYTFGTTGT